MNCNQLLHFDDPEYTDGELNDIRKWERYVTMRGKKSQIVCTSEFTRNYLLERSMVSKIEVIPQGHGISIPDAQSSTRRSANRLGKIRLAYASPYIDVQGDVHGGHINWDASVLLTEIWPKLKETGLFELHLIGKLGVNARKMLDSQFLVTHGLVSISECSAILQECDIGLYPRIKDNFRQAQKISEYIGAGLAIVTFRSIDASLVESLGVGIAVETKEDFVRAILDLEDDRNRLSTLKANSCQSGLNLKWPSLASRLDQISS